MVAARFRSGACLAVALVCGLVGATPAYAVSTNLVISQIYGGGGNTGAPFTNDYIEIFNRGTSPVALSGYSLQYASATGTGNFGANSAQITELPGGVLLPGQYWLIQEGAGAGSGSPLPSPDLVDSTPILMSATGGKVAIVTGTSSLGCNGGSTPCDAAQLARIVDLIGYDGANFFEGAAPAPTLSNTTAAFRAGDGCIDTDNNGADFSAAAPAPRNSMSPLHSCGDSAPSVSSTSPSDGATGVALDSNITINFSEPVNVSGEWYGIFCATSGGHTAAVSGGPTTFTLDPNVNFAPDEQCGVTVKADHVSDQDTNDPPDNMVMNYTFTFQTATAADTAPSVTSTNPTNGATNVPVDANITIDFSEPVAAAAGWYSISCASSGAHTATQSGGPQSYTLDSDADFAFSETCTVTVFASRVTDQDTNDPPDNMSSDYTFTFTTAAPPIQIHDIQGAAHISPYSGQSVSGVEGIVTAERSSSFYMQDPTPDADDATSEGILVFGSGLGALVNVGDHVRVSGTVLEFRPGGSGSDNLTTTEITTPGLSVSVLSLGNPLPATMVVGAGGRVPPSEVIEDDASGSVETSGVFDPAQDGIDFYESFEGMRVQINNAVAVGPTNAFGEIPVLGDGGANEGIRTVRGGVVIRPNDFNPGRVHLDDTLLPTPSLNVGDGFTTAVVGVMDYSFGNFKLNVTVPLTRVDNGLQQEVTRAPRDQEIVVGTYNVENLDPTDGSFSRHADLIVNHLRSPDLIAIEEIQDNDGTANTTVTDASATWNALIAAIKAAGGPDYLFAQIDPVDDQDGGQPGGNIRVGFLYRTDRGLEFIARPGGDSTTPTTVIDHPSGPRLSFSPGRVDPQNPAWDDSRKPLAGEFRMRGKKVFVIANHFASKGGDHPLFGRFQPPVRSSEVQRHAQAQVENDFVDTILAADPQANVIVLGDINDFDFSQTVEILEGGVLTTLMDTLPQAERYSYDFEGNSQVLDQILVSNNLLGNFPIDYDPVHVNSEFADQASDHDPQVARLDLRGRPSPKK